MSEPKSTKTKWLADFHAGGSGRVLGQNDRSGLNRIAIVDPTSRAIRSEGQGTAAHGPRMIKRLFAPPLFKKWMTR